MFYVLAAVAFFLAGGWAVCASENHKRGYFAKRNEHLVCMGTCFVGGVINLLYIAYMR